MVIDSTAHSETMLSGYVAGFSPNTLPGWWEDCALKADQVPIRLASVTSSRYYLPTDPQLQSQVLGERYIRKRL